MDGYFLRHVPAAPESFQGRVAATQGDLEAAVLHRGEPKQVLDCAGNLVALLTAARREAEAISTGDAHLPLARANATLEESAWLLHHLATASQYGRRRARANDLFAEALTACRQHGWRKLEHFVLHHWGRSLAEEGRLEEAERCFVDSRAIRAELGDPLVESSDRALAELAKLRGSA